MRKRSRTYRSRIDNILSVLPQIPFHTLILSSHSFLLFLLFQLLPLPLVHLCSFNSHKLIGRIGIFSCINLSSNT